MSSRPPHVPFVSRCYDELVARVPLACQIMSRDIGGGYVVLCDRFVDGYLHWCFEDIPLFRYDEYRINRIWNERGLEKLNKRLSGMEFE